jgi:hypothetical protein
MPHDHDDDEDFPLADHPGPGGPKAGDPEMNRARDIQHLDVSRTVMPVAERKPNQNGLVTDLPGATLGAPQPSTGLPESAPVMLSWRAFQQTDSYMTNPRDNGFTMFLAGWSARDAQPKE